MESDTKQFYQGGTAMEMYPIILGLSQGPPQYKDVVLPV